MNKSETAELIAMLTALWPDTKLNDLPKTVAVWQMVLEDFPFADIAAAAKRYAKLDHPFFPRPGQLIAEIASSQYDDLVPETAWSEVMAEVRRHPYGVAKIAEKNPEGFWHSVPNPGPSFSHPLIAKAVAGLGWQTICQCEDVQAMQTTFLWALKALKAQAKTNVSLPDRHRALGDGPAGIGGGNEDAS